MVPEVLVMALDGTDVSGGVVVVVVDIVVESEISDEFEWMVVVVGMVVVVVVDVVVDFIVEDCVVVVVAFDVVVEVLVVIFLDVVVPFVGVVDVGDKLEVVVEVITVVCIHGDVVE